VVLAIVVSFGLGWAGHSVVAERELRSVLVGRDLEKVVFAVSTLNSHRSRPDTVDQLQSLQLRSALTSLEELTVKPVKLSLSTPSLREGLRRAEAYALATHDPLLANQCRVIAQRLFNGA
jgi:hypothetical protein